MSIVRVGLAETKNYSDGWDGVFGGKRKKPAKPAKATAKKKPRTAKKKHK